ncbi:YicC family protein [Alphaproteobacteria bacterium]|nr:YicC family protein [Alphaproteobacteria bacterium]
MKSMTGFGRSIKSLENIEWVWEIKSLNSRGLDLRFRLPNGFENFEPNLRKIVTSKIARGSINISLNVTKINDNSSKEINHELLENILKLVKNLSTKPGVGSASPEGILSIPGVFEKKDFIREVNENFKDDIYNNFEESIHDLINSKFTEGEKISLILENIIVNLDNLIQLCRKSLNDSKNIIQANIKLSVEKILNGEVDISKHRLYQELAFIYTRSDIKEELDRMQTHSGVIKSLISEKKPVGRRLEFLAQELNREANTLCSKSILSDINLIGVDIKVLIDQFREQVQNIE